MTNKKDYILFLSLLVVLVFTAYFLVNSKRSKKPITTDYIRPVYLSEPIPSIEDLEAIVNNPKFQEMKYIQSFFNPVLVEKRGRVNPFMPFATKDEE